LKLARPFVDYVSGQLVKGLVRNGAIEADDRAALSEKLAAALTDDLLVEDRLNDEVREIMRSHADEMTRRGVQYHDMFKMIKQELVRKRKLVL